MKVSGLNYSNMPTPGTKEASYRVSKIVQKMARREKRERDAQWKLMKKK